LRVHADRSREFDDPLPELPARTDDQRFLDYTRGFKPVRHDDD
jgi:hypothetical protein